MKYGIAKQNAQQFANERKQPVYIARAVKLNKFMILFDKADVSPNFRIWETIYPTEKHRLSSFDELNNGDKIISPIDNEVTEFYVDKDGEKYLASKKCLYAIYQFNAKDFYIYTGDKEVGEIDKDFCFEGVTE